MSDFMKYDGRTPEPPYETEQDELARLRAAKDGAYEERNRCVALLCALLPAVRTRTAIEGWSEDWHGCVYITLPDGSQASWHFHDSQAHLFAHVPEGDATWDGHTTLEKYERIAACCAPRAQADPRFVDLSVLTPNVGAKRAAEGGPLERPVRPL